MNKWKWLVPTTPPHPSKKPDLVSCLNPGERKDDDAIPIQDHDHYMKMNEHF